MSVTSPPIADTVTDREFNAPSWLPKLAWGLTAVCVVIGIVGGVWRFTGGHAAADYGSYVPWGLWIAAYVALIGASAGAFGLAALIFTQRLRQHYRLAILAMLVALGTFAAGMANVWLDLGHPFRAYKMILDTDFGSVMGLMAWLYSIYAVILLVGLWATRHGNVPALLERFGWVAFLFAIVFAGAEGALFGVVGARPLWESGITPVLFLVEAGLFGTALVAAAGAVFGMLTPHIARRLGTALLGFLGVLLALEWAEFSTGLGAAVPAKADALETILTGEYWWVFWIMHLGLGVVLPGVLLLKGRSRVMIVGIAGGLIGAMGIASKLNLILPALAQEEIEGLTDAFSGPGLTTDYFPSAMEWMVWFGTLGLAGLVVLIGRRYMQGALGAARVTDPAPDDTPAKADALTISRRSFVKTGALVGTGVGVATQLPGVMKTVGTASATGDAPASTGAYELSDPNHILYTSCLQCNTGCPIKVKIVDGIASKIDGNPFSPATFWPQLDYGTSPLDIGGVDGWICPKGQAGIQTTYDPYRIRKVLKRKGARGGDDWESISFEQALDEIVNGGSFADGTTTPGMAELYAVTDSDLAKEMGKAVAGIIAEKEEEKRNELVADFKETFADHLDKMIDPDHPDFGPKNNQFTFAWGRLKDGRAEILRRFASESFGSVNAHGHTTVCQGSLYFTGKAMSEQFIEGKWSGGEKFYWQGDLANTEFAIFVGSNIFEGGYGPPYRVEKVTDGLVSGRLKYVVIDPRLGKTGAKAWKWLPNKPGTEAAIALALIQAIIRDGTYNAGYLQNANKAASSDAGEPNYCNAAWLVKLDDDGKPGKLLRGSDLGLEPEERPTAADPEKTWKFDPFVVLRDGEPVAFDPNDEENVVIGDLLVDATVGDFAVKSGLQLLVDSANEHTVEEWAEIAGVEADALEEIAAEFTRHGRRACADIHRGVSQHTNGYYNVQSWNDLNLLIGNYDYAGGMAVGKTYDQTGAKEGQPYPVKKLTNGSLATMGHTIIRSGKYEQSTIFEGYPAKRPWYPLATDIYQEIVPSIGDAYPYPIKAMFLYMGTPVYSLPAGHTNIEVLKDPAKLPLFVAIDIVVGETSAYADYIIPDLTFLERWEFQKTHPNLIWKNAPVRQPVIAPLTETVTVFGIEQPISMESFLMGLAEKMGLRGFGPDGLGEGVDFLRPEDLYIREVANIAAGEKPDFEDAVSEATDEEVDLFLNSRKHLPLTVFDPDAWKAAVDNDDSMWRRVVTVLNRGGRFQAFEKLLDGEKLANKYGKYLSMYCEKTYDAKDSMTGEHFSGVARFFEPGTDMLGNQVSLDDEAEGYDLTMISFRTIMQTKSRTAGNYWLRAVEPTNYVIINSVDARRLDISDGDTVRVSSKTNPEGVWDLGNGRTVPMDGEVKVLEGLRPGVVGFNLGYGHWSYGSEDVVIDGETVAGDARRRTGIHANAAMRTDTHNPNTTLSDTVGGSAVFYDTRVKLEKV